MPSPIISNGLEAVHRTQSKKEETKVVWEPEEGEGEGRRDSNLAVTTGGAWEGRSRESL